MNFVEEKNIVVEDIEIRNFLPKIGIENVRTEIINGLNSESKFIMSKYFYDKIGSELFEEITKLDEYYLSRCEKEILSSLVDRLNIDFRNLDIIELGSGDASKISLIFNQISHEILKTINYFPVDISQPAIEKSVKEITSQFHLNSITGIIADFYYQLDIIPRNRERLFCFLGSTIGNYNFDEIKMFFSQLEVLMQPGDSLLLGTDMIKEISILEKAYNDGKGITAAFNKNILSVVNTLIGSDFIKNDFEHLAFYNSKKCRIEMYLKAITNVNSHVRGASKPIVIMKGETIHTENSQKFSHENLKLIENFAGLKLEKILSDSKDWFNLVYYKKNE